MKHQSIKSKERKGKGREREDGKEREVEGMTPNKLDETKNIY